MLNMKTFLKAVLVLVFLYLFLVSIGLMGVAFKGFGGAFAKSLIQTTSNPFVGLFIGILATSIIQSSSTTTSIVVGMVASGVITVGNAVPIVMGANVGTTVTGILVSMGHLGRREEFRRAVGGGTLDGFFKLMCVCILFPLELATGFLEKIATRTSCLFANCGGLEFANPIKSATEPLIKVIRLILIRLFHLPRKIAYILMLIIALAILFSALYFIVKFMSSLVVKRAEIILNNVIGRNGLLAAAAVMVFTAIIQSSSITIALMIPLMAAGVLRLETMYPMVMGANIGTTVTAILASLATANPAAISVAFVHFFFNAIGVTCFYPIKPLRKIPVLLAGGLGNLGFRRRRYVIIYALIVFFVIPGVLIAIFK
jgi:sodium-dependent phosphate cotransporter